MKRTVISLCDRTGNMVLPWLEAGFNAVTVDLQEQENPHPRRIHFVDDVSKWNPGVGYNSTICMVFAFPPCTDLASSGARWFKEKGLEALADSIRLVARCHRIAELSGAPWMIENPIGALSTHWRDPDYIFDPCDYGDPYTKKTCLWTGAGFVMPPKIAQGDMFEKPTMVPATEGSIMHRLPPSEDRANLRSITPVGFARAVFAANHPKMALAD